MFLMTGCGQRNEGGRVVGGSPTSHNAYPWLARLIYHQSFGCGASLINDKYVVSAAHCVKGYVVNYCFLVRLTLTDYCQRQGSLKEHDHSATCQRVDDIRGVAMYVHIMCRDAERKNKEFLFRKKVTAQNTHVLRFDTI